MDLRVAAYGIITDDQDRLLLAHWREGQHSAWTLPGGGLEAGESPEDALRREITEETGYTADIGALLGIHSRVIPARRRTIASENPLHTLRIVYRAAITGGALRNEIGGSTDEARWVPLAQVRSLGHTQLIELALDWAGITLPPA